MTEIRDVLLDIEGTTSSIRFVHDVLFPYARERMAAFVAEHRDDASVSAELERAKVSLRERGRPAETEDQVVAGLVRYIDEDVKDTALKALQGMIWRSGYETGAYRSHVYPEVPSAMAKWQTAGYRLSIYSSGSIAAQKLLFAHTEAGDLTPLLFRYFDTTTGPKRASASYHAIASALERSPSEVLFLSDVEAELDAASEMGLRTCQILRPGTAPGAGHPTAPDFEVVEAQILKLR